MAVIGTQTENWAAGAGLAIVAQYGWYPFDDPGTGDFGGISIYTKPA